MASFIVKDVRIFTGEEVVESGNVLVEEGTIKYFGNDTPDTDAPVVSGSGSTLIPGLIDAHIHADKGRVLALEQSLRFGVTTVLDMHNEPPNVAKLKKVARERNDVADFKSSCLAATIDQGWPAPIVTLHDKSEEVGICRLGQTCSADRAMLDTGRSSNLAKTSQDRGCRAVRGAKHQRWRRLYQIESVPPHFAADTLAYLFSA